MRPTLKGFANCRTLSGLRWNLWFDPRVLAALEPWAGISERLRRFTRSEISEHPRRLTTGWN